MFWKRRRFKYVGKGVELIEGEVCPDHVHILVSIPSKMSVWVFMGQFNRKRIKNRGKRLKIA